MSRSDSTADGNPANQLHDAKQAVRERVWSALESENAVATDPYGRIPLFIGSGDAASQLATLTEWRSAEVIKANPDRAQHPVRLRALQEGKRVYMAVPGLKEKNPFVLLDPASLDGALVDAATSEGGMVLGRPVDLDEMEAIDLVVSGTVAVNRDGVRIGKGGGYADIELALLAGIGLVTLETVVTTTVHDLQVLDGPLPATEHDFHIHVIATPSETIQCPRHRWLPEIRWDHLDAEKASAIPVLARQTSPSERIHFSS